ncbi:asparagine-linked glycosylation 5 homolog (yeast, dolichyl-phosphate beta-glucosyltransferase), isoform CRA_g [Rattus norvegicus]|uniref:Asparagine-linked glycosylation 5 homolog (Yeast, dolichyl-phosphate beta-glucosyltransferase), isoform CRA_g n=1 Tax=Rattus norvegicus TaxID=10116 RepID=A6JVD4_RAT|nr:asparagine-linked glycosylation 5 homolog (yeast, dolichyl-phosphate beta-glucosyltransferase), isoform CRA_g [Rattus norvegicus]
MAALRGVWVSIVAFITATKMPPCHRHEEEKFFLNARGQKEALPSIWDSPTKQLSVVVPSYNEEKRLPVMMDEALNYLEKRQVSNFSQCHVSSQNDGRTPVIDPNLGSVGVIAHPWATCGSAGCWLSASRPSMQCAPSGNRQTRELEFLSCPLPQLLILSCLVTYRLHASECVQTYFCDVFKDRRM